MYYIVGRDWPDNFYATNAKWPEPALWHYRPENRTKGFRASAEEMKRARALEEQAEARAEARALKKQLFGAIVQRDNSTVRSLLKRCPLLLEKRTGWGATPLGLAAAVGDAPTVSLLLAEGADVTAADRVGATPLIAAAARGHTEVCQLLLASKQGGNAGRAFLLAARTRAAGEAAAHAAAKGGHTDTLAALLAAGAEAAAADRQGRDCLMLAAANDHPGVMSYLLQNHGVSPARTDAAGRTALMHAAAGGGVQAVRLLLSLDPPPDLGLRDAAGRGPLHHACLGGSVEVLEELSSRGLSLPPSDPLSLELLRLAAGAGHAGVVDWMLAAGVGLQAIVSDGSSNPMYAAVRGGSTEVVDAMLRHGARIDPRDSRGRTPLGVAAAAGDTALCVHLVACGASLTAADNHGRVPRRLAYEAQHRETAEALAGIARRRLLVPDDAISEQQEEAAGGAWAL